MKYKVMFYYNLSGGGNPDGVGSFTFYTLNQAISACQAWALTDPGRSTANLWDGTIWRFYQ